MKKILILLVAMFGMTLQGTAQLTLKYPAWEKFAKITTDGVNLRKAPSVNSPKLYSKDESWGHEIHIEYSWNARSGYTPHRFEVGEVFPILEETDEWYHLYFDRYDDIYIMKKFCTVVSPATITDDDLYSCEMEIVKGNKGYLLGLYFFGSAVVEPYVRIGHKAGKFIVAADYGEDAIGFVQKYNDEELGYPNVEKIKEIECERFLKTHKPVDDCYDVWIKFPGKNGLSQFIFSANTYKYKMNTQTY